MLVHTLDSNSNHKSLFQMKDLNNIKFLFNACRDGDAVEVGACLASLNHYHKSYHSGIYSSEDYSRPLTIAIQNGRLEVVRELLTDFLDLGDTDRDLMTALHLACKTGNPLIVDLLVKDRRMTKEIINKVNYDNDGSALLACKNPEVMKILLAHEEVDIAVFTKCYFNTALHIACTNGYLKCVDVLLKDSRMTIEILNQQNRKGKTALMIASENHSEIVKCLLGRNEVDLAVSDTDGNTALHITCAIGNVDTLTLLIQDGRMTSDIMNKENWFGPTPLIEAAKEHPEMIKCLLGSNEADLAVADKNSNSALQILNVKMEMLTV